MLILLPFAFLFCSFMRTFQTEKDSPVSYKNNKNNVIFTELVRYETESVMLRTDISVRLLIPHGELDKHYTKLDN
jgi:hypothetical protein